MSDATDPCAHGADVCAKCVADAEALRSERSALQEQYLAVATLLNETEAERDGAILARDAAWFALRMTQNENRKLQYRVDVLKAEAKRGKGR